MKHKDAENIGPSFSLLEAGSLGEGYQVFREQGRK